MTYGIRTLKRQPDPDLIERQAAADLVMLARRVTLKRPLLTVEQREEYAKRFDAAALEFTNAAIAMRRGAPDPDHIPEFLRPDSAARFHD